MNIDEIEKELHKHQHIVVCWSDLNSLGVVRSLGEKGINPILIILKGGMNIVEQSKYVKKIIYIEDEEECITVLQQFKNTDCKPFVYTCDDRHQRVLDHHYEKLKDYFYFFNAGDNDRITYYTDKNNCCDLALECGFNVPKKEVINVGELPQSVPYPIFVKTLTPYSIGWKHDVGIYYNSQELQESFSNFKSKESLIAQEYIQKKGEISMQGVSINAGQEIYLPFERMYLRYSDTSFGGYMYYQPFENKELLSKIQTMIQAIRYSGCFEIEFLVDQSDKLYFLEINLRFSASNYGVTYGGCNQPYLWAIATLLGRIPTDYIHPLTKRFYVMNEIIDIRYAKSVGLFHWIKECINADCYYLFNFKDIIPFVKFIFKKIKICK